MQVEQAKSSFRKLTEMTDKIAREELGDYYIISSCRMENLLCCLETGSAEINKLRAGQDAANKLVQQLKAAIQLAVPIVQQDRGDGNVSQHDEELDKLLAALATAELWQKGAV